MGSRKGDFLGYLYAMKNPSQPGKYKIGWTTNPAQRRSDLSGTAVPDPYVIVLSYPVKKARKAEKLAFSLLNDFRYNERREFFCCDFEKLLSVLNAVQRHINMGVPLPSSFISDDEIDRLQSRDCAK
jgi:hypothetical protein